MTTEPVAPDDLRTFLGLLWAPGDVREVRIPKYIQVPIPQVGV
jgi:hypothetical protein